MRSVAMRKVVPGVLVLAAIVTMWSIVYARGRSSVPARGQTTPASTAAPSRPDGDIPDMGATYYWLDARARKVTTRFKDGTAAAERGLDGDVSARVYDAVGNELAILRVDRIGAAIAKVDFTTAEGRVSTMTREGVVPTLEWANLQARTLLKDGATAGAQLEWHGRIARPRGAARDAVEDAAIEVGAEFDTGIVAVTRRNDRDVTIGATLRRPTFSTRVTADGVEVGAIRWYEKEQILAFNFPGLTSDIFTAETLKPLGGWTFKPTMAWANVQGLAFYEFHRRVKMLAKADAAVTSGSRLRAAYEALVPTLHADEGCDYLHWLDTSVFRPCCDSHDKCYAQDSRNCGQTSWFWPFTSSWVCETCNISAAWCFTGVAGACISIPGACIDYQY